MASAVLANRTTEPNWASPSQPTHTPLSNRGGPKYMGKLPSYSNPNPKFPKKGKLLQPLPLLDIEEPPGGGLTQSAASDDASSINRRPNNNNNHNYNNGDYNLGGYVTFNVSTYTKKELIELKNRLVSELERIRQLKSRIESSDLPHHNKKPIPPSSKKSNIHNLSGNKRPLPPAGSMAKDPKRGIVNMGNSSVNLAEKAALMKKCGQILSKLMKHKLGYIFNTPVDVVGMKLHDYYDIIKCPMDLGTVKAKLGKNGYNSPWEFAADVRLTFDNAMRYNPKGHEVYVLAEQFIGRFEEWFLPIKEKLGDGKAGIGGVVVEDDEEEEERVREVEASSWDDARGDVLDLGRKDREDYMQVVAKPDPIGLDQNLNQIHETNSSVVQSGGEAATSSQLPVRTPSPPMRAPAVKPLKQPKPKAKDPNKREMSLEEKHKLGLGLQSLPPEKMEQVVGIIKKRNGHLRQDGDEIELDIEAVDIETLWELDRFVTNYKKAVSKIRRQGLMGVNNVPTAVAPSGANKDVPVNEIMEVVPEAKKPKKGDAGDEDVDIGDEMPMSSFPPVEIEKDNGHASSSSGSSSSSSDDSSSSSDSDSGSSSGSDSEDAHS